MFEIFIFNRFRDKATVYVKCHVKYTANYLGSRSNNYGILKLKSKSKDTPE